MRSFLVPLCLAIAAPAARADAPSPSPIASSDESTHFALGARVRGLFVPGSLLGPFVDQAQSSSSYSVGGELTKRKGALDVVLSLDWSSFAPGDGNWLGGGKNAVLDTHWVEFRGLNLLTADVSFVWAPDITPWMSFLFGGGIGLGLVFGDIYVVNNSDAVCTAANANQPTDSPGPPAQKGCYPIVNPANYKYPGASLTYVDANGVTKPLSGALQPSDPDFQRKLDGLTRAQAACVAAGGADCRDTAMHPYFHASQDKPPVMVVVNVLIGLRFKLQRHLNLNVTGGFRDGFFVGGGPEYVF